MDPMTVLEMNSVETKFLFASKMRDRFCRKLRERCRRYKFRIFCDLKKKLKKKKTEKMKRRIKRAKIMLESSHYRTCRLIGSRGSGSKDRLLGSMSLKCFNPHGFYGFHGYFALCQIFTFRPISVSFSR